MIYIMKHLFRSQITASPGCRPLAAGPCPGPAVEKVGGGDRPRGAAKSVDAFWLGIIWNNDFHLGRGGAK